MKVIFLDIDGVLNVIPQGHDEYGAIFHPEFVTNLKWIIELTEAKIVVSSSWRLNGLIALQEMWKHRDLPGEIIDTTPSIYLDKSEISFHNGHQQKHPTPRTWDYSMPRGCEIEYWLQNVGKFPRFKNNREKFEKYLEQSDIKNFVILDDDTDMLYSQKEHFVRTSLNHDHPDCIDIGYGLTKQCTSQAIKILNTNIVDLHFPKKPD